MTCVPTCTVHVPQCHDSDNCVCGLILLMSSDYSQVQSSLIVLD